MSFYSKLLFYFFIPLFIFSAYFSFILVYNLQNYNFTNEKETALESKKYVEPEKKAFDFSSLSPKQKAGNLLLTSLEGEVLNQQEIDLLKSQEVAGFILFAKNIKDKQQVIDLSKSIYRQASSSAVKPFVAVDQEGGTVSRLSFIDTTSQAEIKEAQQAYEVGFKRGRELKAIGVNLNFSPVVEASQNNDSFISIQKRAFANHNRELSEKMIAGYKQAGIVPVAKHFPGGLGRVTTDPHYSLPQIEYDLNKLTEDIYNFTYLAKKQVPAIMVTHLLYQDIDPLPASSSQIFIDKILRRDLGFKGVVVIDDMSMGAITENFKVSNLAIKSIEAGADLLIISDFSHYEKVLESLSQKIENDEIFSQKVEQSLQRIWQLKTTSNSQI